MAQAIIQRLGVNGADQITARGVTHAEALIDGLEGRAGLRAGDELGGRIVAVALSRLLELVLELIGAVDGRTAFLRLVRLVEQRNERRGGRYLGAQLREVLAHVVVAAAAAHLEHTARAIVDLDALVAVLDGAARRPIVHLPVPLARVEAAREEAHEQLTVTDLVRLQA